MTPWTDGCTLWPDLWYRACCDLHDDAFAGGSVDWQTHVDLGFCVIDTAPGWLQPIAIIIGGVMFVGTAAWWAVKYRLLRSNRKGR